MDILELLYIRRNSEEFKRACRIFNRIVDIHIRSRDAETLTQDDFYDKVKTLTNLGYKQIKHVLLKADIKKKQYILTKYKKKYFYLVYKDEKGDIYLYKTHSIDDAKNKQTDHSELTRFKKSFKEEHNISFKENFGSTPYEYKRYVPGLFHWDNVEIVNKQTTQLVRDKIGKVDFSSHFIACSLGELPDAKTAITVDKYVKPTEEYPFAFYPDTHNIAEYNNFDTHELREKWKPTDEEFKANRNIALWKPENNYDGIDTKTILMKKAQYTLDDLLQPLYQNKKNSVKGTVEYEEAKLLMLKMVGKFEMTDPLWYISNPYAHLAAIIKGRAIKRMDEVIDRIGGKMNVIEVIVDGLIYKNYKKEVIGDKEEYLGSLKQEMVCGKGTFRAHNQYVLKEGRNKIKCHAGFDTNIESDNIDDWIASDKVNFGKRLAKLSEIEVLE